MVFTENQATQFYVAESFSTDKVTNASAKCAISVGETQDKFIFLNVKGADTVLRSDIINPRLISYVKATASSNMETPLKTATIKLNSEINSGAPVSGQDYTVNIFIRQYIGMSDEDIHVKTAAVHAYKDMTAATFYEKLAASLYLNFSREIEPLVKFTLGGKDVAGVKDNGSGVKLPVDSDGNFITGNANGVIITELAQDWTLGIQEQVPVYFTVCPTSITLDGDEVNNWASVTYGTNGTIKNGHKIADMEYFFMGERGDQYRNIKWPKSIHTEYLVDPTKEYNTINIHYSYVGENESVQKSEKDIIIASTSKTIIDQIGSAIANKSGISYTPLVQKDTENSGTE